MCLHHHDSLWCGVGRMKQLWKSCRTRSNRDDLQSKSRLSLTIVLAKLTITEGIFQFLCLWYKATWLLKEFLLRKTFSQIGQITFWCWCICWSLMCLFWEDLELNILPHSSHENTSPGNKWLDHLCHAGAVPAEKKTPKFLPVVYSAKGWNM